MPGDLQSALKKLQALAADRNCAALADKRSAINVEEEWAKGELGGHERTLADFARFRNFSAPIQDFSGAPPAIITVVDRCH